MTKTEQIDLGLAVIEVVARPGLAWTLRDIADVCGCTWQAIYHVEQRALRKLRITLQRETNRELREAFGAMLGGERMARLPARRAA